MPETGIARILIQEDEITKIVDRLGQEITKHYQQVNEDLIVVGLLRGSFVFMADLVRRIHYPMTVDFMAITSYGHGTVSSGDVKIIMDLDESAEGKHILFVEDIIDTGNTFNKVIRMMNNRNPASVRVCTLLSKPSRRLVDINIDFCGCEIPDEFVCGYGLDYAQKYRNLPYIGVLDV